NLHKQFVVPLQEESKEDVAEDVDDDAEPSTDPNAFPENERKMYEKLCRKAVGLSPKVAAKLYCRYFHNQNPFLRIGPVKMEEAYLKPRIVVFHEIMFDSEISVIKDLAVSRLRRATVQDYVTGDLKPAEYRISKSAWLKTEEHPLLRRFVNRIGQ
ncbi:unnamed protein product, partial [Notodromas monacha]